MALPKRSWLFALLAFAVLLSTFDGTLSGGPAAAPSAAGVEDTRQALQGTWLRETTADGMTARRVLVLDRDGKFNETVRVTDAAGLVRVFEHEGTWLFDGTNLKRKYTLMDGKPPSRLNVPFATFQIVMDSRNAFTGTDHIHGHVVKYTRVPEGTEP
jgi:hypothetical protein